jgi:hypothetical protein
MATVATQITSTGNLLVNGTFDEVTSIAPSTFRTTVDTVYANTFDEVTYSVTNPVIYNKMTYSQDLTQWSKNASPNDYTATANATTAPDRSNTGNFLLKPALSGSSTAFKGFTGGAINTAYCGSIYLKSGGYTKASVYFGGSAFAANSGCNVDLTAGTITSVIGGSTCTITDAGNGWWRITVTATSDADGGNYLLAFNPLNAAGSSVFTGDGTSGIYMWGAQVELGSTATIYQGIAATGVLVTPGFAKREAPDGTIYVTGIFDEF